MLRIRALDIHVQLEDDQRKFQTTFINGVNIITSPLNTSGKSAIINSIIYALGLEELINGKKGHSALSSAFHNKIWDEPGENEAVSKTYDVLYSTILLEISNGENIITLKRNVSHPVINDNLITVYHSRLKDIENHGVNKKEYYINSKGAAQNTKGFFTFFENFLSINLPLVPKYRGGTSKLYLQNIFGSLFIEQKKGWGDVLAGVPNYGIINVKQRVIEYLLSLDTLNIEKNKSELLSEIEKVRKYWEILLKEFSSKAFPFYISNLEREPIELIESMIKNDEIQLIQEHGDSFIIIEEYILQQERKLDELNNSIYRKNKDTYLLQEEKDKVITEINLIEDKQKNLEKKANLITLEIEEYDRSKNIINEDILNNIDLKKLKELGAEEDVSVFNNICPVCHQKVNDSLLDTQQDIQIMSIDENITYLKNQLSLFENLIIQKNKQKQNFNNDIKLLKEEKNILNSLVQSFNNDLYNISESYSEANIERKIRLKLDIDDKKNLVIKFDKLLEKLTDLSQQMTMLKEKQKELPSERLSSLDIKKLNYFNKYFTYYLKEFDYRSVSDINDIGISKDTYMPEANGFDLKSDSSASDNIRAIWAYTIGLMETSQFFSGNHPGLIFFDEPKQHSIHEKDMREFFNIIMAFKSEQVIVGFTQDQLDNPEVLIEYLADSDCNIIDLGTKAFK